jgi:hypothetical protein
MGCRLRMKEVQHDAEDFHHRANLFKDAALFQIRLAQNRKPSSLPNLM